MGCCCSSNAQNIYEEDDKDDRRNLLASPDGEAPRDSVKYGTENGNGKLSCDEKVGEQEQIDKILEETASNYIDVPAMNSPFEQPDSNQIIDYYDLTSKEVLRRYSLTGVSFPLLADDPYRIEAILSDIPLMEHDIHMINDFSASIAEAVMTKINVNYSEDIIIPFKGC